MDPPPSPCTRSAAREKVQSPMGRLTRAGWTGCPPNRAPRSGIDGFLADAHHLGAIGAAEDALPQLDAVADHAASAVLAGGRHPLNRAFERVEDAHASLIPDLQCLPVLVPTDLTACHRQSSPPAYTSQYGGGPLGGWGPAPLRATATVPFWGSAA